MPVWAHILLKFGIFFFLLHLLNYCCILYIQLMCTWTHICTNTCVCVCVCVWAKLLQSCPTLCDPTVVACQAPLSMGFSRQVYWSGLSSPPPGYLPDPGIKPASLSSPALAGEFFTIYIPSGLTFALILECIFNSFRQKSKL